MNRITRSKFLLNYVSVAAFGFLQLGIASKVVVNNVPLILVSIFIYFACAVYTIVGARLRCHDLGHSGWLIMNPIISLLLLFADGQPFTNKYGPDPKARDQ